VVEEGYVVRLRNDLFCSIRRALGNDALLTIYSKGVRRGGLGFQLEYLGEEAGLVKN
jgi:hypothetical protein